MTVTDEQTEQALTAREKAMLRAMRFRAAGEADPERQVCWLGAGQRNRWALIVPTVTGGWERLDWFNGSTLARLEERGLIAYGPDTDLPEQVAFTHYPRGGRRVLVRYGSTVQITDAGLAAISEVPLRARESQA